MVTTINYSTSAHSTNVNLTKYKTWGLSGKLIVTCPWRCLQHTFGHTDLVTASKVFTQTPTVIYSFPCFSLYQQSFVLTLPKITWAEPPDILGYSPSPLPVRHTQHWFHKPCFLQYFAEEERVTKKRGEGRNQIHSHLRLCGSAAVSHAVLLRTIRMSELVCHMCLAKATLI